MFRYKIAGRGGGGGRGDDARECASAPRRRDQQKRDARTITTTASARLSPRADLWVYLLASSSAAVAALAAASSGTTPEKLAVAAVSLSLVVALFVSLEFRFEPSRDRLTRPFGGGGGGGGVVNCTMEMIFASFVLLLWVFVAAVALDGGGMTSSGGVGGGGMPRDVASSSSGERPGPNLFYATCASLALVGYIAADVATTDDPSGVVPYHHDQGRRTDRNRESRSWMLLFAASSVLFSFNLAAGAGEVCSGRLLRGTEVCRRTAAGAAFGSLGALTSTAYSVVQIRFPSRRHSSGTIMSGAMTISFAVNAGLQTSPGSPGSEPSPLYWASWICLALSFHLCACHVETCLASGKTPDEESYVFGNGKEEEEDIAFGDAFRDGERVPLVQHRVLPAYQHHAPAVSKSVETPSGETAPRSEPEPARSEASTSNSASNGDDDDDDDDDDGSPSGKSLGGSSDSGLLLFLPSNSNDNESDESAITFNASAVGPSQTQGDGVGRFLRDEAPRGPAVWANRARAGSGSDSPVDPVDRRQHHGGGASRTTDGKSSTTAKEQKKDMLFEKMNDRAANGDDNTEATRSVSVAGNATNTLEKSAFKRNLRQYLKGLGLPRGIFSTISRNYESCDSRLWLIDNSAPMKARDSHLIGGSMETILRKDRVSRWEELRECVAFHAKMAARTWVPTKFWLVNDPGSEDPSLAGVTRKFSLCWDTPREITREMNQVRRVMTTAMPRLPECPLARHVRSVRGGVAGEASRLESRGKHIAFVISTHGVSTDAHGRTGPAALREFEEALAALAELPVRIVLRLCTDDCEVVDAHSALGSRLNRCDVLDDYWGESAEVFLHNPWLTYGIGLHRMREAGLAWGLMDELNERPLSLDGIHNFCKMLFLGEDGRAATELPHPRDWMGFVRGLTRILKDEKPIWNPVLKRKTPWINLSKLHVAHGPSRPVVTDYSKSDLSLREILRRWSRRPPGYRASRPLDVLLVTVPDIFPPKNARVEAHAYFGKWKTLARDAFTDVSGDDLNELLKRAVRKAKFFLRPDNIPRDLTENQALLLKTIWDTILEQEAATLTRN